MLKGIRWRFVSIYIILLATAMIVAHFFIIRNIEALNIKNIKEEMIAKSEIIIASSSSLHTNSLLDSSFEIEETVAQWGLNSDERVYIIDMNVAPPVIVASSKSLGEIRDIYSDSLISTILIDEAKKGERAFGEYRDENTDKDRLHLSSPILTNTGSLNGILYMTKDLNKVYQMLEDTTLIIYKAILISLILTVVLGIFVANGITTPIRQVTEKARLMAQGDFDQKVEVKSDDEIGNLATMFNFLTEKLKQTIGEMELERSKLATIFLHMQEGVVAIDLEDKIIHANPIAREILRLPEENVENIETLFPESIKKIAQEGSDLITIGGKVYKVKIASFSDDYGIEAGNILVFQDMTSEHRLDEMRKEFVANVSHELKTPITTIITYTETILESRPDELTTHRFLETVEEEAQRMNRIVKDLLSLSNMDYEKSPWKKERADLKDIILSTIKKVSILIEEKGHRIETSLIEAIVEVDREAIERVFLNILSNSIKYTNDEGEILVGMIKEEGRVKVEISDNGIGIPKEDLERVFERFYRVEKGRSREMGGTGLGLSIAKEIITGHNGTITMDSIFGEGTKTTIILPLSNSVSI